MEKDKKYNLVLGLMLFFFILFVGVCVAWGLGLIGIKSNVDSTTSDNNTQLSNNTNTTINTDTTQDKTINKEADITINDLFAFDVQNNEYALILKIENNDLKYFLTDYETDLTYPNIDSNNSHFKVLDTNVKRIKTVTLGSDTWLSFLIIKNDGTTYQLTVKGDYSGISYEKYGMLDEYKIDNISNIKAVGGMSAGFEADVILLDGTSKHIIKTFETE